MGKKAAYDSKNKGKGAKKPVKQTGKKPLTRQDSALNGPAPAVSAPRNSNKGGRASFATFLQDSVGQVKNQTFSF